MLIERTAALIPSSSTKLFPAFLTRFSAGQAAVFQRPSVSVERALPHPHFYASMSQ